MSDIVDKILETDATWNKYKTHCPACGELEWDDITTWLHSKHFSLRHILWWKLKKRMASHE